MQQPSAIGPVRVLSVSPFREDHKTLENLLSGRHWKIVRALTLDHANQFIMHEAFSMVVCERELTPGSWKDVLCDISSLPSPPFLIVTSSHADDYLWSEALNLGAYNVLTKPFENIEVIRTLSMALFHRQNQIDVSPPRVRPQPGKRSPCVVE